MHVKPTNFQIKKDVEKFLRHVQLKTYFHENLNTSKFANPILPPRKCRHDIQILKFNRVSNFQPDSRTMGGAWQQWYTKNISYTVCSEFLSVCRAVASLIDTEWGGGDEFKVESEVIINPL